MANSAVRVSVEGYGLTESIVRQAKEAERYIRPIRLSVDDRASLPLGRISAQAKAFENSLTAASARVFAFGATVGVFAGISRAIDNLISSTVEVDKRLRQINATFGLSSESIKKFGNDLFSVAKNTEQSFGTVADAALELARQGLSAEETLKRLRDAMILTRLSGMEAQDSVSTLTATINGFTSEVLDSSTILNKLVAVDQRFAVSTADLANGLQRVASVAQDANVSFDELLGMITAAQQKTARGGAVIGNAFKSIFTRINRPEVLDQLRDMGIAINDVSGKTLPAIQIMANLANSYDNLSNAQKSQISQSVAGLYQINILKASLKDLGSQNSIAARATEAASLASEDAYRRNELMNKSISAMFNQTAQGFKELAAEIGSSFMDKSWVQELLTSLNAGLGNITTDLKGDEAGQSFGQGLIRGITNVLAGPGAAIGAVLFSKVATQIGQFATEVLQSLLTFNKSKKDQENTQIAINNLLRKATDEENRMFLAAKSVADQQKIIESIFERIALTSRIAATETAALAQALRSAGVVGKVDGGNIVLSRKTPGGTLRAAEGLIPAVAKESQSIRQGIGGAQPNARPVVIPNFNFGGGKRGSVVANTDEYLIPNFAGRSGSAIFNRAMVARHGLPPNAKKITSNGLIPNFASFWLRERGLAEEIGRGLLGSAFRYKKRPGIVTKGYRRGDSDAEIALEFDGLRKLSSASHGSIEFPRPFGSRERSIQRGYMGKPFIPNADKFFEKIRSPFSDYAFSAVTREFRSTANSAGYGNYDLDLHGGNFGFNDRAAEIFNKINRNVDSRKIDLFELIMRDSDKRRTFFDRIGKAGAKFSAFDPLMPIGAKATGFIPNFSPAINSEQLRKLISSKKFQSIIYRNQAGEIGKLNAAQHLVRRDKLVGAAAPDGYGSWGNFDAKTGTIVLHGIKEGEAEAGFRRLKLSNILAVHANNQKYDVASNGLIPNFANWRLMEKDLVEGLGSGYFGSAQRFLKRPDIITKIYNRDADASIENDFFTYEEMQKFNSPAINFTPVYGSLKRSLQRGYVGKPFVPNAAGLEKLVTRDSQLSSRFARQRFEDMFNIYVEDLYYKSNLPGNSKIDIHSGNYGFNDRAKEILSRIFRPADRKMGDFLRIGRPDTISKFFDKLGKAGAKFHVYDLTTPNANGFIPNYARKLNKIKGPQIRYEGKWEDWEGQPESWTYFGPDLKNAYGHHPSGSTIFAETLRRFGIKVPTATARGQKFPVAYGAKGFIPNFASPLTEAIRRERKAGVSVDKIRIEQSKKLRTSKNPLGLAITNTIDEPHGIEQGIARAKSYGLDPTTHGAATGLIPNFAPPGALTRQQVEELVLEPLRKEFKLSPGLTEEQIIQNLRTRKTFGAGARPVSSKKIKDFIGQQVSMAYAKLLQGYKPETALIGGFEESAREIESMTKEEFRSISQRMQAETGRGFTRRTAASFLRKQFKAVPEAEIDFPVKGVNLQKAESFELSDPSKRAQQEAFILKQKLGIFKAQLAINKEASKELGVQTRLADLVEKRSATAKTIEPNLPRSRRSLTRAEEQVIKSGSSLGLLKQQFAEQEGETYKAWQTGRRTRIGVAPATTPEMYGPPMPTREQVARMGPLSPLREYYEPGFNRPLGGSTFAGHGASRGWSLSAEEKIALRGQYMPPVGKSPKQMASETRERQILESIAKRDSIAAGHERALRAKADVRARNIYGLPTGSVLNNPDVQELIRKQTEEEYSKLIAGQQFNQTTGRNIRAQRRGAQIQKSALQRMSLIEETVGSAGSFSRSKSVQAKTLAALGGSMTEQERVAFNQANRSRLERRRASMTSGAFAASFALPMAAGFIPEGRGGTTRGMTLGAASGALQWGGTGLGVGAMFGPMGAAIGGGIGVAVGVVSGALMKSKKSIEEFGQELEKINDISARLDGSFGLLLDATSRMSETDSAQGRARLAKIQQQSLSEIQKLSPGTYKELMGGPLTYKSISEAQDKAQSEQLLAASIKNIEALPALLAKATPEQAGSALRASGVEFANLISNISGAQKLLQGISLSKVGTTKANFPADGEFATLAGLAPSGMEMADYTNQIVEFNNALDSLTGILKSTGNEKLLPSVGGLREVAKNSPESIAPLLTVVQEAIKGGEQFRAEQTKREPFIVNARAMRQEWFNEDIKNFAKLMSGSEIVKAQKAALDEIRGLGTPSSAEGVAALKSLTPEKAAGITLEELQKIFPDVEISKLTDAINKNTMKMTEVNYARQSAFEAGNARFIGRRGNLDFNTFLTARRGSGRTGTEAASLNFSKQETILKRFADLGVDVSGEETKLKSRRLFTNAPANFEALFKERGSGLAGVNRQMFLGDAEYRKSVMSRMNEQQRMNANLVYGYGSQALESGALGANYSISGRSALSGGSIMTGSAVRVIPGEMTSEEPSKWKEVFDTMSAEASALLEKPIEKVYKVVVDITNSAKEQLSDEQIKAIETKIAEIIAPLSKALDDLKRNAPPAPPSVKK